MSVSALFGSKLPLLPSPSPPTAATASKPFPKLHFPGTGAFPAIECSSRPQKKATAHHRKTRPKKSQPWDIRRGPAVYPPLPPLPAEWSFAPAAADDMAEEVLETSAPPLETTV